MAAARLTGTAKIQTLATAYFVIIQLNNNNWVFSLRQSCTVGVRSICQLGKNLSGLPNVIVVVGQVHLGPNHCEVELIVDPALAQPRVEDGRIKSGVGTNQQHKVCVLHPGDASVEEVVGPVISDRLNSNFRR